MSVGCKSYASIALCDWCCSTSIRCHNSILWCCICAGVLFCICCTAAELTRPSKGSTIGALAGFCGLQEDALPLGAPCYRVTTRAWLPESPLLGLTNCRADECHRVSSALTLRADMFGNDVEPMFSENAFAAANELGPSRGACPQRQPRWEGTSPFAGWSSKKSRGPFFSEPVLRVPSPSVTGTESRMEVCQLHVARPFVCVVSRKRLLGGQARNLSPLVGR